MRYLLLIYTHSEAYEGWTEADNQQLMDEYWKYEEETAKSGHKIASDALQGVETATTVRVRGGDVQTTDGPFAETKEVLGGYYLMECTDLDEAIALAARIPDAKHGSIEVRPIMEFEPPAG